MGVVARIFHRGFLEMERIEFEVVERRLSVGVALRAIILLSISLWAAIWIVVTGIWQ